MPDAALSEPRPAALESSGPSKPMKPAACETWRGWSADVWGPHPAAGMEGPDARKAWGGWCADAHSCGPAKSMQTAAPSKAGRDRRADVGNSGAVELMRIAAAEAATESAAGKAGGEGRSAGVETRRGANAGCASLAKPWTTADGRSAGIDGVSRLGMRNDDPAVMMVPDRRPNERRDRAAPTKTIVPLVAARIIAGAVRAVVVPAIPTVLDCLDGR
jgi:hypothetical protein